METRSNILLVAFVGGLLFAALLAFTYYLAMGTGSFGARYEIRFSKSVSGLNEGAPVEMQGVTVGRVELIELDTQNPGSTRVIVAVDEELPLRQGVRADISRAFMDCSASIVLLPSSDGPLINSEGKRLARIESVAGGRNRDPSAEALEVAGKLDKAVESLDSEGQARISQRIAETVEETAGWERGVAGFFGGFPKQEVRDAADGMSRASETAERLNGSMHSAYEDIDKVRGDIRDLGDEAQKAADAIALARPSARSMARQSREARETVSRARSTIGDVKNQVEPVTAR